MRAGTRTNEAVRKKGSGARDHAILDALACGDAISRHRLPLPQSRLSGRRDDLRHYRNRGMTASLTGKGNVFCNLDGTATRCTDTGIAASR